MKPILILAAIGGGATGILTLTIFKAGLRAPASPGSIIAVLIQTASDSYIGVILAVLFAATVSFLIASVILRATRGDDVEGDLAAATASMEAMKGKKSSVSGMLIGDAATTSAVATTPRTTVATKPINKIVFACDAGMGSSAMGASVLRNKIKKAGITDVSVVNLAIANLQDDVDLIVTHQDLTDRAKQKAPSAEHVSVENFMNSPRYDEVVAEVKASHGQ
jgi:PTS system mannitol-specific IIC component